MSFVDFSVRAQEVEGLPKPTEPRPAKLVAPRETTLANGIRVIVIERPGLPLLSAAVLLRHGSEADPAQASGLAAFTAALLTQGTEIRTATQIAREVEALGATLKAYADWDGTAVSLATLSAQAEPAFALLADVTRHPKFAPEEIERLRKQTLDELRLSFEEPGTIAKLAANRVLFGQGLYGHPAKGTPASIKRVGRQEIAAFHSAYFTADQAQIVIAGNIAADTAFALAEKNFGDWPRSSGGDAAKADSYTPVAKPRAVLIDMPNAGQAAVVVAFPSIARNADDYFSGLVANAVLGGGYTSRLNQEIRVKRGLSYGAASSLNALRSGGYATARCQTKNVSAAEVIGIMRTELQKLGAESVPADYLSSRQAVLTGDFARDLETNSGYVTRVASFLMHGQPLETLGQFLDRIQHVGGDEVRTFAKQHFDTAPLNIIVAGRAKECAKTLRTLLPELEIIPQSELDLDSPTLRRPGKR